MSEPLDVLATVDLPARASNPDVRVRFCPSPTGNPHVGIGCIGDPGTAEAVRRDVVAMLRLGRADDLPARLGGGPSGRSRPPGGCSGADHAGPPSAHVVAGLQPPRSSRTSGEG